MKPKSNLARATLLVIALAVAPVCSNAGPYPQAPFYQYVAPVPVAWDQVQPDDPNINLTNIPPATSAAAAALNFNARAAAAILQAANSPAPTDNLNNGEGYQVWLLAKWAYLDFLTSNPQEAPRHDRFDTYAAILDHQVGVEGTDTGSGSQNDYDACLNSYIPLIYRYYASMPSEVSEYLLTTLLSQATRSGIPGGRSGVGPMESTWSENIHIADVVDIPETENHLLGIETARYLINQLLFQRTQNPAYDNLRNGNSDTGAPNTTDWILHALQGFLRDDFQEYNGRPYQDYTMSALLNLASYAYDDRVRLGARMVLDYVSAKIAVSSNDLRRSPPFRRRNELAHYGPTIQGNFLGSPLIANMCCVQNSNDAYEPDPQIGFYTLLAGNTQILFSNPPLSPGHLPGNYNWEMVHAALSDYRIPTPILDLFARRDQRRFYQYFHHYAGNDEYTDELYAGSPSYLIAGGGRPTTYCYPADVKAPAQVLVDAIAAGLGGVPLAIAALIANDALYGSTSDLGVAMPTVFMPTGQGLMLSEMIQFGEYTTDRSKIHLGVAPDFACGDSLYLPPSILNDPAKVVNGNWTFINRGGSAGQPGYYLAINMANNGHGGQGGFLEAYDTLLHPGFSFAAFWQAVLAANPAINLQFDQNRVNSYITRSGQTVWFTLTADTQIVGTTELNPPPSNNSAFTAGSVLNSAQGSAVVALANPATGAAITLDMSDAFHPRRTSETGELNYGGEEVWVNFNYGANVGDFAQPYRTLGAASASLSSPEPAKTFKIISGVEHESITLTRPVTLIAVGGPVTIYGQ